MGYILPVTNYQYMQYAERETGVDYDPFPLTRITSIRKQDPVQQGESLAGAVQQYSAVRPKSSIKRVSHRIVERTFAEMTGKGKNFSQTI
ncbi:hypothetical protein [Bacillus sp. T33-2]|uniref:hypothetical protein n=1 Tax=Bacillus sp. T33-2 TaxID=2054168 RepID=UPI000C77C75F|nr:hypothetical protein [Bacillus sp. T33-2]PLR97582.1 hypothetical protein CVD19_08875 [Bacillus sp. T33-2]